MARRGRSGGGGGPPGGRRLGAGGAIGVAGAPRVATALRVGEVVGGEGAAEALGALGLAGGVLVPAVLDGRTEGALGLLAHDHGDGPAAADLAAARAAAALIAL